MAPVYYRGYFFTRDFGKIIAMIMQLPRDVKFIIDTLTEAGYEAYAVGGCVRDTILGREPDDWDITTSAKPYEIKALFHPTIDTGIQHGTVTVLRNHVGYEVTTYRIDGVYEDSRHPKEVTFTANLTEDLLRRDFTINAMAYNDTDGLIDEYGGLEDIRNGIIRCVGVAKERFTEDALRMMRAVRFSAQLGYEIEDKTADAIVELHQNLKNISAERINTELTKLLMSDHPDYLRKAYELGITSVVLPEFDQCMKLEQKHIHHCYSVGEHILHSLDHVEKDKVLRYSMLFHDLGKPACLSWGDDGQTHFHGHNVVSADLSHAIMKRLRFDNDTLAKVEKLVRNHDRKIETNRRAVRRAMNQMSVELFPLLLLVKEADVYAQSDYKRQEKLDELASLWELYDQVMESKECVSLKDLELTGRDLIAIGLPTGPDIGRVLNELLVKVIDDPELNKKDILIEEAKKLL